MRKTAAERTTLAAILRSEGAGNAQFVVNSTSQRAYGRGQRGSADVRYDKAQNQASAPLSGRGAVLRGVLSREGCQQSSMTKRLSTSGSAHWCLSDGKAYCRPLSEICNGRFH